MHAVLQFGVGAIFGVLVITYLNKNIQDTPVSSSRNSDVHQYPGPGVVSRDDVSGGVFVRKELQDFSVGEVMGNGTLQFIQATDGVFVAHGYSYVNVIVVEGPEGLIIIDTSESPKTAAVVRQELRQFNKKPIKAIVLTHFHADHINGVQEFIEDESNPPDVWAHHLQEETVRANKVFGPKAMRGGIHQFGIFLGKDRVFPRTPHGLLPVAPHWPNKLVRDEVEHVQIAGLNVTFMHVPGETDDHLVVWFPDKRVLMPGDNFYSIFPNLYAIRGTPPRDPLAWANGLLLIRDLNAEHLVPSHGQPVSGAQNVFDLLTVYSSAIFFVHDQTVRLMNEFHHPDEIGRSLKLPSALATHPALGQFYGFVEWASKGVYMRYVGWFSGDPADLIPLTPPERSQALVDFIGVDRILKEAESALRSGRTQWSLELSSHVHRVQPDNLHAKWLRLQALRQRAAEQINPSARNYYLTAALDSYGHVNWNLKGESLVSDVSSVMGLMRYRLKAELTDGVNSTIYLYFSDSKTTYRFQILYSILEVNELSTDDASKIRSDATRITSTETVWTEVLLGRIHAATAFTNGQLTVDGSLADVRKFMSYF